MRYKILSSVVMMLLSISSWGQVHSHKLPAPQMATEPPPPGLILPIDDIFIYWQPPVLGWVFTF